MPKPDVKIRVTLVLASALASCTTIPESPFASTEMRPAAFVDGRGSFPSRLRFPAGEDDVSVGLVCTAAIGRYGEMLFVRCPDGRENAWPMRIAVANAANGSRVAPALYAGKAVQIAMSFRVEFERRDGRESIQIYPNSGWNQDTHGPDYVAAQRVLERFSDAPYTGDPNPCNTEDAQVLTTSILRDGSLLDVNVEGTDDTEACQQYASEILRHQTFIPAHANGRPVASVYRQVMRPRNQTAAPLRDRQRGPLDRRLTDPRFVQPPPTPTPAVFPGNKQN